MFDYPLLATLISETLAINALGFAFSSSVARKKGFFLCLIAFFIGQIGFAFLFSFLSAAFPSPYLIWNLSHVLIGMFAESLLLFSFLDASSPGKAFLCLLFYCVSGFSFFAGLVSFDASSLAHFIIPEIFQSVGVLLSAYPLGLACVVFVLHPNASLIPDHSFKDIGINFFVFLFSFLSLSLLHAFCFANGGLFALVEASVSLFYSLSFFSLCLFRVKQEKSEFDSLLLKALWEEDKKKYQALLENNEIIALTVHDLKHQIENLGELGIGEDMVATLKKSIKMREAYLKTGNDVLDVILYQFALRAEKDGVSFTAMADGSLISFLSAGETYSLVGNLLDNAIEYLRSKPALEDKFISLTIKKEKETVVVHIENLYVDEAPSVLSTSKKDKKSHGFGIKSARRVCLNHHGELSYYVEDRMFQVDARFLEEASHA